jgi:hypothetical protein
LERFHQDLDSPHSTRERIGTTTKNPCNNPNKKKHTHTQQQQSHGRKRKNKNKQLLNLEKKQQQKQKQQQERRSNLSPQKLRAAKFNAKKQHAQKPDT